jgi:hypothetical protein
MITAERLRELLSYDPETGVFRWLVRRLPGNIRKQSISGYRGIHIDGRRYKCSRLVWLYQTGEWPTHEIDHVNGDRVDNRFCNLREATLTENRWNSRKRVNNTSGYKGVSWDSARSLWKARINVGGKEKHLGRKGRGSLTFLQLGIIMAILRG